jgi:hypothetical protein
VLHTTGLRFGLHYKYKKIVQLYLIHLIIVTELFNRFTWQNLKPRFSVNLADMNPPNGLANARPVGLGIPLLKRS